MHPRHAAELEGTCLSMITAAAAYSGKMLPFWVFALNKRIENLGKARRVRTD